MLRSKTMDQTICLSLKNNYARFMRRFTLINYPKKKFAIPNLLLSSVPEVIYYKNSKE